MKIASFYAGVDGFENQSTKTIFQLLSSLRFHTLSRRLQYLKKSI